MSSGSVTRTRSAEQTARLLLSNAFRYDSWECASARKGLQRAGGDARTVVLTFSPAAAQSFPSAASAEAFSLSVFDTETRSFVGATHRCHRRDLHQPLVFQATAKQVLVVEALARDGRPGAPLEEMRVLHWASCPIESLGTPSVMALRPGNGHLLLLEKALWPVESLPTAPAVGGLAYKCKVDDDAALAQLMTELVPPGVFVSEAFTRATPPETTSGSTFRLVLASIELVGTSAESAAGLADEGADWAVAAVAHNGYRQLGEGAEVPLAITAEPPTTTTDDDDDDDYSDSSSTNEKSAGSSDSSYGYSYGSKSSGGRKPHGTASSSTARNNKSKKKNDAGQQKREKRTTSSSSTAALTLRSELPLEIGGLPVHAATSLVLAIRRRTRESRDFAVVGFCVFPLCVLPMRSRDVRVENLPALRGPFSCEDARMLMVDSASPYGRVPIAMTLTVEYHDVDGDGGDGQQQPHGSPPAADTVTAPPPTPRQLRQEQLGPRLMDTTPSSTASTKGSPPSRRSSGHPQQQPPTGTMAGPGSALGSAVLSTADSPGEAAGLPPRLPSSAAGGASPSPLDDGPLRGGAVAGSGDGVFRLLCTIMEELQKVREGQDAILRQTAAGRRGRLHPGDMSPETAERLGQQLADGPLELADLAPQPLAVSWRARRAITDDVQPILHPTRGTLLDEGAPAPPGSLPANLCGIRFEGMTLDTAVTAPEDLCVLFSFGPLPCQQVGPLRATVVERRDDEASESFKFYDEDGRGGLVWCEPVEAVADLAMAKYKEGGGNATVYLHLYDALTMFYVATANLPLAAFHRPFNVEAAVTQTDLLLQRDLSMTEQVVPPKIFPVVRSAGQLHVSLFCVGVAGAGVGGAPVKSTTTRLPPSSAAPGSSRVIVAKKLRRVDELVKNGSGSPPPPPLPPQQQQPSASPTSPLSEEAAMAAGGVSASSQLHWQRAAYVKQQLAAHTAGSPLLPGLPAAHVSDAQSRADLEYLLRFSEKQRGEAKAQAIARALLDRMTVHHDVGVVAWRPEVVRTPFQNPYSTPVQFHVHVPASAAGDEPFCSPIEGGASFFLGPRERTEVPLVVRVFPAKGGPRIGDTVTLHAKLVTERGDVVQRITIAATLSTPLVDRRYEVFGPAGSNVEKRVFSRLFASSSFPITSNQAELLARMRGLCSYAATSCVNGRTAVETNAVLDPVTQTFVTAWEEATIRTTIPAAAGRQRVEYVTLFHDAAMTRVLETWELCIFACDCLTTREVVWGQTTALGLPAAGSDDMYCSDRGIEVSRVESSYVLRIRPKEVGTQRTLLHTLTTAGDLRKTLLTIPAVHPTPSYTQVLELSLDEVAAGPVFRRLTFRHRGVTEETFRVHHNYRYQLKVSPARFALAPGDSQFISLQFDALVLPPGQLEGRWPVWIFINDAADKTVESYYLQVVVRAHAVVAVPEA